LQNHYGGGQNAAQMRPGTVEQVEYRPERGKAQGGKQKFGGYIRQIGLSSIYLSPTLGHSQSPFKTASCKSMCRETAGFGRIFTARSKKSKKFFPRVPSLISFFDFFDPAVM
jgi:hypothetical protein